MLRIKLSRIGKKKAPIYRLTIAEQSRDPYGRALEILGSYNPFSKELKVETERIQYWLSQGATMTDSVNNLLVNHSIIKGEKAKGYKVSKRRVAKIDAQKKDKEVTEAKATAKATAEAEAAAAAKAEPVVEATPEPTQE